VVDLTGSTVAENATRGAYAERGGVLADVLMIERSTLADNSTAGDFAKAGGASGEYVLLVDSSVVGNTTTGNNALGGGIAGVFADIVNSTIVGNGTSGFGAGGVFGNVEIVSSTITGNSTAGGVRSVNKNVITVTNSLVLGNVATGDDTSSLADDILAPPGLEEIGANIIGGDAAAVFVDVAEILADSDGDGVGDLPTGVIGGTTGDHGGAGPTVLLRRDGSAVDAAGLIDDPVEFDQRGVVRPQGTQADLGAVELEPAAEARGEVLHAINLGGDAVEGFTGTSDGRAVDFAADDGSYLAAGGQGVFQNPAFGGADSLLGSERWDPGSGAEMLWQLPVASGTEVVVELYFAEIYEPLATAGNRIFDVQLENQTVLDDLDVAAEAGFGNLLVKSFETTVDADGFLDLAFGHAGADNPKINAIAVYARDTTTDTSGDDGATMLLPEAVDLFG